MAQIGARRELLAIAVASGKTLSDAAAAVTMSRRTATRLAADDRFRQRVAELQESMTADALTLLSNSLGDAVSTLKELLLADSPGVRLNAAKALLAFGLRERDDGGDDGRDRPAGFPADPLAPLHEYFKGITDPLLTQLLDAVAADNARRRAEEAEIQARTMTCRIALPSGSEGQADDA